jgi:integrase
MPRQRRGKGDGSIFQRANGTWVGAIDLGWKTGPDGVRRRNRPSVTGKTRNEVVGKLRKKQQEVDAGVLGDGATVEQWLQHWLTTIAPARVRQRTLDGYAGYMRTWLVPHLGRYRLDQLQPDHIRAMYKAMEDAGKSHATRRQAHAILRRALVVAEMDGKILRNPAAKVDPPSTYQKHHEPLTLAQARQVLAALETEPVNMAARWTCALLEGMRQGECLGLKWDCVDIENRRIWITNELIRIKGQGMQDAPPKSEASNRAIPMLEPVALLLSGMPRTGEYVFYGGKMDSRKDWAAWKALLVKAGVCDADTPPGEMPALHAARGTAASLLDAAGISEKVVSEIIGHTSVLVTRKHYIHGNEARHRQAMAALEAFVKPDAV